LPRVYAVVNQKGGVGKTTTAINVAANLPELGLSGLIVDMDPQGNTTSGLGIVRSELSHSIYNVIIDAEDINDVIRPTAVPGLGDRAHQLAPPGTAAALRARVAARCL